jgi:hypothetical protein
VKGFRALLSDQRNQNIKKKREKRKETFGGATKDEVIIEIHYR